MVADLLRSGNVAAVESYQELTGYTDDELIEIFNDGRQNVSLESSGIWMS